jgi:hypothetical protein
VQLPCCDSVIDLVNLHVRLLRHLFGRAPDDADDCAATDPDAVVPVDEFEAGTPADAVAAGEETGAAGAATTGETILIGCSGE